MSQAFSFGNWVQTLRKARRLSRQALCDRARGLGFQLSQQYIHVIESGHATNIGSDKIQALAAGLQVPLAILEQALFHGMMPDLPVTGRAAAGLQVGALSEEYCEQAPYEAFSPACYFVEIMGDSMAPKLAHGDLALVQPLPPQAGNWPGAIKNGHIYLVENRKTHRQTCKYLVQDSAAAPGEQPPAYWLVAENPDLFPKTRFDPAADRLLGEVVEVRKSLSLPRPVLR